MINSLSDNDKVYLLWVLLGLIVFFIIALVIFLLYEKHKEKTKEINKVKQGEEEKIINRPKISYSAEPIVNFMEFEKIEDNMIIQKNDKFLMVVECQGINYDLMSEMEKASVEQGFTSFLNTLRYPIQIYIQTRTVNLEKSVENYKAKLDDIKKKYKKQQIEYENALNSTNRNQERIDRLKYEKVKQKNLMDYTEDIIRDIERQSLNQNILGRRYYIIVPCYKSEIAVGDFDKTEVKNMAFSELYTRARAVINSLFACQVTGKILTSDELTELLYVAYNRDEADLFWIDKIRQAGLNELYSTAPDVIDKKMKILDKQIEKESAELANIKINEARREKEILIMEKEKNKQEIVNKKAKELIKRNKKYVGEEIAQLAIDKISNKQKENNITEESGGKVENEPIQEKTKRGRARKK